MTRCLNCGRTLDAAADCPCHDQSEQQPDFESFVAQVATGATRITSVSTGNHPGGWWMWAENNGLEVVRYTVATQDEARAMAEQVFDAASSAA